MNKLKRDIYVMGILVDERDRQAPELQKILPKYGSMILCRNGIPDHKRQRGIITLTIKANSQGKEAFEKELNQLSGIIFKSLCLTDSIE